MNSNIELNSIKFSEQLNATKYLQHMKQFPILSAEEEYDLTKKYFLNKDKRIANKIITSHLRLVVKIVKGYRGYGLPADEMISEGSLGLLVALKNLILIKVLDFQPTHYGGLKLMYKNIY